MSKWTRNDSDSDWVNWEWCRYHLPSKDPGRARPGACSHALRPAGTHSRATPHHMPDCNSTAGPARTTTTAKTTY